MSSPIPPDDREAIRAANETGLIAHHRELYLRDGEAGHLWDSNVVGGPGPLATLLLFTTGRKSGHESIMPLIYGEVDGSYVVIASKGGAKDHPGWYHNLMAQPEVKMKVKNDVFQARHRVATGAEREKIWEQMAKVYPPYNEYQARTQREIPVIVLERAR